MTRGYFGIGIEHGKTVANLGTLWRSAHVLGAAFIFTIGRRYQKQCSDTMQTPRHIPLYHYADFDAFYSQMPHDCMLVGIEISERAEPLATFVHPQRAIYLLGAEDHGLTAQAMGKCHRLVVLPGEFCLNVAVAGSIAMYHRHAQQSGALRKAS